MIALFSELDRQAPSVARAVVRANDDPDQRGRIRVEYPWFFAESAQTPSEWARICFPYASSGSGAWMLPEIGDEVLVLFENGDLEHPIVLGTLYSEKNKPPKSGRTGDLNDNNKNDLKFIRTRAGHLLCFDDSDGDGGIVLKDKDNRRFEIKSKGKKIEIADAAENRITIEESTITVRHKSGDEIKLKGGEVVIQSSGKISLGEGASHPLIFGDLFQQIFNAHTHPIPTGSSGPPATPMTPAMLSQKTKTV